MHASDSQSQSSVIASFAAEATAALAAGLSRCAARRQGFRAALVLVGLIAVTECCSAAAARLPAERQAVVDSLQQRALLTLDRDQSRVWSSLAAYAEEDLARSESDGPWPLIAHASTRLLQPDAKAPTVMTAAIGHAFDAAHPIETRLQLSLLTLDTGETFLFAEPAIAGEALQIYQHHLEQQSIRYPRGQEEAKAIRDVGGVRWARVLMRVQPAPGRGVMRGERVTVLRDGQPQTVVLPSRSELEAHIGVPLDDAIRRQRRPVPKSVNHNRSGSSSRIASDQQPSPRRSITSAEQNMLREFQRRALLALDPGKASGWRRLARFAEADLQDAREPSEARKFWEAVTDSTTQLQPLATRDVLQVGTTVPELQPVTTRFAFCLVQMPQQTLLFGWPDLGVEPAGRIYAMHRHQATALSDTPDHQATLERLIITSGPERWAVLLAPLELRGFTPVDEDIPLPRRSALEKLIGTRAHLATARSTHQQPRLIPDPSEHPLSLETVDGPPPGGAASRNSTIAKTEPAVKEAESNRNPRVRTSPGGVPAEATPSSGSPANPRRIRRKLPPDPFDDTPPGGTILVAVDWSASVADKRPWLLEEVRSLLDSIPEESLIDGGVRLQSAGQSVLWSREAIRAGRWPSELPKPHDSDAAGTLGSFLKTARSRSRIERTVLVVWNSTGFPETRTEFDRRVRSQLGDVPTGEVAADVGLTILQVHGRRLGFLKDLAGEASYQIFRYRPNGPAALQLGQPLRR